MPSQSLKPLTSQSETGLRTPKKLAEYLECSEVQLWKLRKEGCGPKFIQMGRNIRYRDADVEEWLAEQIVEPNPTHMKTLRH